MNGITSKIQIIPSALRHTGLTESYRYNGPSMRPTFRPGQILYVRPDVEDLNPGDVVVYQQKDNYIVHRLLAVGANGYVLRGDNNRRIDGGAVRPEQVIGRVEMVEEGGVFSRVVGGHLGLKLAQFRWGTNRLKAGLRYLFGWPYRYFKAKRVIAHFWKPEITVMHLQTETGSLYKYIYHNKTVATWNPAREILQCRRPFDLVIFPNRQAASTLL